MQNRKIRIMIVEDSRLYQRFLQKVIETEACLEVAGIAGSGEEAKRMTETLKPDVITLDLHLPDVSGFELLEYFLEHTGIPVIVVSSQPRMCEQAIRLGAKDFMEKITDTTPRSAEEFSLLLRLKLKMQARASGPATWTVRPVRQPEAAARSGPPEVKQSELRLPEIRRKAGTMIAIGASLGGTESTLEVLRELPEDMPGILIVQHMPKGFTKAYATRLNQNCRLEVSEARNGDRILPGRVLVAESGRQMTVVKRAEGYCVRIREGEPVNGFCPSVDVMFSSIAETDANGIGVILTGMGHDGVLGIRKLHEKGFYTIGQDEESCAVFGMPQAAFQAQALDELLSPGQIAERIIKLCKTDKRKR